MDLSKPLWIGAVNDVRYDDIAEKSLEEINDSKYWNDENGITSVNQERWEIAQKFEYDCWLKYALHACDDRSQEHYVGFDSYKSLSSNLGKILEIGCGPFTQLRTIIDNKIVESISLLDPLLNAYLEHPNCQYKENQMCGVDIINKLSIPAEELKIIDEFDTVICINVLEHVKNAREVFDNIYNSIKSDGIIIFHERSWDHININMIYDAGHPIRLKNKFIKCFLNQFKVIYNENDYFIGIK